FIEANLPIESVKPASPFHRLMIAQDTGSAIVGPARADLYWGAGDDAGCIAGRLHHRGRFVMLLPRELDMIEAGRHMPLPPPKPRTLELAVNNHDKRNVDTANSDKDRRAATRSVRQSVPVFRTPASSAARESSRSGLMRPIARAGYGLGSR
ncbi:MAG: 3D domain-containing protein, partial [Rhodoplanes sp.]